MNPQKKFLHSASNMEEALAKTIKSASQNDRVSPKELNRIIELVTKKGIVLDKFNE